MEKTIDILIIGAGTAGLSAAIYGVRSGKSVLLIENYVHGGQIINTTMVENYPAIPQITGVEFAQSLYNQAIELGAELVYEEIIALDLMKNIKEVRTEENTYHGKAVIIANGARHRTLDCPGEVEFTGRGVSYCATCDGAIYRNKDVAIVGGGNTALEDALFLSNVCNKVYLIHRRDQFRAERILVDSVLERSNIQPVYDSVVTAIKGEKVVQSVVVNNFKTKEDTELVVSGVFIAVGLAPENHLFTGQVNTDEAGYVIAGEDCHTNLDGVYVAGDTRTKILRQLVTAASDGAVAATQAALYLDRK